MRSGLTLLVFAVLASTLLIPDSHSAEGLQPHEIPVIQVHPNYRNQESHVQRQCQTDCGGGTGSPCWVCGIMVTPKGAEDACVSAPCGVRGRSQCSVGADGICRVSGVECQSICA